MIAAAIRTSRKVILDAVAAARGGLVSRLGFIRMVFFPQFPACQCQFHPVNQSEGVAEDALLDPFAYLPAPIEFTDQMAVLAERYRSHDIDWRYYPAFQAAAFLESQTLAQHSERREQFLHLKKSVESLGFSLPKALTQLFLTDAYIDRLHHNCIWPTLPDEIVQLPSRPEFAVFLFLIEGQGCGIWHLLLGPEGAHTVITADVRFGCVGGYPPDRVPDPAAFRVAQCLPTLNHLLYHYFRESAQHDAQYMATLTRYFAECPGS